MYLCQNIEELTDRRYQHAWRVVTFRVVLVDNVLKWERWREGRWWLALRLSNGNYHTAKYRAQRHREKGIPTFQSVSHGQKVTDTQAARLVGLKKGYPHSIARDMLIDKEQESGWLSDDVIRNFDPAKEVKSEADKLREEITEREKVIKAAEENVAKYDSRIRRYTNLKKKWEKRVAYLTRRLEKVKEEANGAD